MWNWSQAGSPPAAQPIPTAANHGNVYSASLQRPQNGALPTGYATQPLNAQNFYYGYQGNGYPSYTTPHPRGSIPALPHRQSLEPRFTPKPRQNSAVPEVRPPKSKASRKAAKRQAKKAPIVKRKEKLERQSAAPGVSSFFEASTSGRSDSVVSSDSHFGGPDLVQETVQGRASFLVVDDHRSEADRRSTADDRRSVSVDNRSATEDHRSVGRRSLASLGNRSTRSHASTTEFREYRPAHIPDPPVPGFPHSDDSSTESDKGSFAGKGYTRSIETASLGNPSEAHSDSSGEEFSSPAIPYTTNPAPPPPPPIPPPSIPPPPIPPPAAPPQPLYSVVNKERSGKKPTFEDPIYSTIDEAKKGDPRSFSAKPTNVLDELKLKLSLRSKAKVLAYAEELQTEKESETENTYPSAFRPYQPVVTKDTPTMNTKENIYDQPIPIDKVIMRDGSEPSDLPSTSGAPANEDGTRTSSEIPPSLAYNDGMEPSVIEQPMLDVVQETSETKSQVSGSAQASGSVHASGSGMGTDTKIVPQTVNLYYPGTSGDSLKPPEQGSVLSVQSNTSSKVASQVPSQTHSHQSNVTVRSDHSSLTGSHIRHEPIASASFIPKSILKNKFGHDSSSSESESSEEEEAEKAEYANERYHLTIPMETGAAQEGLAQPPPAIVLEREATPIGSLRDARKRSLSKNTGVSFTQDTRDNEGTAKKYEQERTSPREEPAAIPITMEPVAIETAPAPPAPPPPAPAPPPAPVHVIQPASQPQPAPVHVVQPLPPPQPKPLAMVSAETGERVATKSTKEIGTVTDPELDDSEHSEDSAAARQRAIEPTKNEDYSVTMTSPKGILKHANGTATLQLHQRNQFVISPANASKTLPKGALMVNTNINGMNGALRSGGYSPTMFSPPSPGFSLNPSPTGRKSPSTPTYTVRHTGDNVSVVSISGYEPWDSKSNHSNDTIRTLDDYQTGTIRTMISLGTYNNPYGGNEGMVKEMYPYARHMSESSTDPLAFTMPYDSKLFEYNTQQQNGGVIKVQKYKKRESRHSPIPGKHRKSNRQSKTSKSTKTSTKAPPAPAGPLQKKTTFADHALGADSLFRAEKKKTRRKRMIKIGAVLIIVAVVILTVALVIYFLTDKDNQQD